MRIVCSYGGKEFVFESDKSQTVIGRPQPGIVIDLNLTPDTKVSRPHAVLSYEVGRYWIQDLGSMQGTLLNGEEIQNTGRRGIHPPSARSP